MTLAYSWRLVYRNPRRTLTYLFGLAMAVGLFAGILFFVDATTRQMTTLALAPVKLDIVAHATTPDVNAGDVAAALRAQSSLKQVEAVSAADFASAVRVGGTQASAAGRMFAISASYLQSFDLLQISQGSFKPGGALVSEAMAIAQNLRVGDSLQLTFSGINQPIVLPVAGIVDTSGADALFTTATEAENAVVADVLFVDIGWFQANLQAPLLALAAAPPATLPPGAILLDPQVHIRIDRSLLPADPTRAALQTDALRRQIERQFPGQLKAVDNLSGALKSATSDVLSAKILFIFLGLPGVALAAYLSKFAAELFAEAQRREIGLLRARGARPGQITAIVAIAALLLAIGGSALGLLVGVLAVFVSDTSQAAGGLNPFVPGFDWSAFGASAGIAFAAGLLLTFTAAFLPTFGALRAEITQERRAFRRTATSPFWKRAYLDLMLLGAAALVLVITEMNGGIKPTGDEGAALSLSFYIFLAPFFAWIGLTLLTLRLIERALSVGARPLAFGFRSIFGDVGEVAGKSVARRAARVSAATTVIALTVSFGFSLAIFQQTYTHEKRLDAQYIVGSDIRFTPALNTPQRAGFASQLKIAGVADVTAVARDTQALVGSEKNTVYGIDVASFGRTAYLPDSFFVDGAAQQTIDAMRDHTTSVARGSAQQVLGALAKTPNGVIISVEQAQKYNIVLGDSVLLRLYDRATGAYLDVRTQAVGLFVYFPTSSQDSDFIVNRDFMTSSSGNPAMDYFLIRTNGREGAVTSVSDALAAQYRNIMSARIASTETVVKTEESSLTSLNLAGLGAMERLYTLLVTSLGLGIFLLAMINERRREFGTMRALGANLGHLRRFLFAEALTISALSLVLGTVVGIVLAQLLVMLLGVIFTIPAQTLDWPIGDLAVLGLLVVGGMLVSVSFSARRLAGLRVVEALREL